MDHPNGDPVPWGPYPFRPVSFIKQICIYSFHCFLLFVFLALQVGPWGVPCDIPVKSRSLRGPFPFGLTSIIQRYMYYKYLYVCCSCAGCRVWNGPGAVPMDFPSLSIQTNILYKHTVIIIHICGWVSHGPSK